MDRAFGSNTLGPVVIGVLPVVALLILWARPARAENDVVVLDDVVVSTKTVAASKTVVSGKTVVSSETAASTTKDKIDAFDGARRQIFPTAAATTSKIDHAAIEDRPQGADTPFDTLLSQLPGVSLDSAASRPDVHIRNEYSNAQYRINGILLPDTVSGLGAILDTSFVGTLSLLDGALPAQYGLRTAGVIDITSRSFGTPEGSVGIYGGSHGTIASRFDYGGISGATQYFVAMRGLRTNVGIENATPSFDPVHDRSRQGKGFGYVSTVLSDSARVSLVAGVATSAYQIPDLPGTSAVDPFGVAHDSASLDDRETDRFAFVLGALQTNSATVDSQLSVFTRYAQVHFLPDVEGGLAFNGVASDVARRSTLNGADYDAAYRLDARQTVRAGFGITAEQTDNDNRLTALPIASNGLPKVEPVHFQDNQATLGINIGGYLQDEIKLTPGLTVNVGARFDQLDQYVSTNQVSPRLGLTWQVMPETIAHAGYARYFTPPSQSEAASANVAAAAGTTLAPEITLADPVRPERSHYFDVGLDRTIAPGFDVGLDGYLKVATDYIDDGDFGDALVISQVNYARATSQGLEFKARFQRDGFSAYGNLSTARSKDTRPVSNQYVFDASEYAYLSHNSIFADDVQLLTASAGAAYRFQDTMLSANLVYGSGLRSGFANLGHVPAYTEVNLGFAQDLRIGSVRNAMTVRFDIVNLFDTSYQLRDGSGIGVEAPQYGPRRGFFVGLVKHI